jgi:hypothetical protein
MKKHINKFLFLGLGLVLAVSCRDEGTYPLPIDQFNTGGAGGVFMRQLEVLSGIFNDETRPTANFAIRVEAVDGKQGSSIENIDVLAEFIDRTEANGTNNRTERLVKTIPFAGNFEIDATSQLPRGVISVTLTEVRNALQLTDAQLDRTDQFIIRHAVRLKDGRVFSSNNTSQAMLTGGFYQSPFRNIVSLSCPSTIEGELDYRTTVTALGPGGSLSSCAPAVTGTITLSGRDGQYRLSDASFGMYACAYSDNPATGVTLNDVCRLLFFTGADQYDIIYEITAATVNGTRLTLNISNDYGDVYSVELTRKDGRNWPSDIRI